MNEGMNDAPHYKTGVYDIAINDTPKETNIESFYASR